LQNIEDENEEKNCLFVVSLEVLSGKRRHESLIQEGKKEESSG